MLNSLSRIFFRKSHLYFSIFFFLSAGCCFAQEDSATAFRKICGRLTEKAVRGNATTVVGRQGWLFLRSELRHLSVGKFWGDRATVVSRATKTKWADPLPVIVDFNNQLKRAGIQLLFVPVPAKALVYPDMMDSLQIKTPLPRLDVYHQQFYNLLQKAGVKVIDLLPLFLKERQKSEEKVYCKQDTHWATRGMEIAVGEIIKQLPAGIVSPDSQVTADFETQEQFIQIKGDLAEAVNPPPGTERIRLNIVQLKVGEQLKPVSPDNKSPILLLGDSHTLVFNAGGDLYATRAGIFDLLSKDIGNPLDLMGVRGSGATSSRLNLYRRIRSQPRYLPEKKVVIWCLSMREFTESSGWRMIPIVK